MPVYAFDGKKPVIGKGTWIAPNAYVIGDVRIGDRCYIGFGAVIRGDFGRIEIGDECAIEEGVVIHGPTQTLIGNRVIAGHMAMIHNATIRDCALIGMQAMICDNCVIGEWAIVAEKSMVLKNMTLPGKKIYRGIPAAEVADLQQRHYDYLSFGQLAYVDLAEKYRESFERMDRL
ncbi:MAG TPA: gamma carbonic anhydrase family protein [Spirochaetota bacterium]|nr:gamma carbonic anhydrase family protein [Spirochaetota bacterium]